MRRRRGFTLVELVVAMAVFLAIIAMAFGTLSGYFAARSANEQQLILQQNFRNALDRIRYDFAQASSNTAISSPESNAVSRDLIFTGSDGVEIAYRLVTDGATGTSHLARVVAGKDQPVTEEMHQLVDLYFVRSGGKIVVVIVGHMTYFGRDRTVPFASMIVSRNANYESVSVGNP